MTAGTNPGGFKCSAIRAVHAAVESPNWQMNLVWLSLAALLQHFIVGAVFAFGYGAEVIQSRAGLPGRRNPDIAPNRISETFLLGLWAFLVYLISALVVSLLSTLTILAIAAIVALSIPADAREYVPIVMAIVIVPLSLLAQLMIAMIVGPLCIRAMICQDFQKSFDIAWLKSFLKLMFRDMLISSLALGLIAIPLLMLGLLLFCVGIYPAMGILTGASLHLLSQWYELFLLRGGQPVKPAGDAILDATVV
jgi:hypothetical protein